MNDLLCYYRSLQIKLWKKPNKAERQSKKGFLCFSWLNKDDRYILKTWTLGRQGKWNSPCNKSDLWLMFVIPYFNNKVLACVRSYKMSMMKLLPKSCTIYVS